MAWGSVGSAASLLGSISTSGLSSWPSATIQNIAACAVTKNYGGATGIVFLCIICVSLGFVLGCGCCGCLIVAKENWPAHVGWNGECHYAPGRSEGAGPVRRRPAVLAREGAAAPGPSGDT